MQSHNTTISLHILHYNWLLSHLWLLLEEEGGEGEEGKVIISILLQWVLIFL
jgi:hypothetical protein